MSAASSSVGRIVFGDDLQQRLPDPASVVIVSLVEAWGAERVPLGSAVAACGVCGRRSWRTPADRPDLALASGARERAPEGALPVCRDCADEQMPGWRSLLPGAQA